MTDNHNRIFGLDLIRSIAVILVLIAHTLTFVGKADFFYAVSGYSAVIGVELFFVLSGFLIGTILIKTHNKDEITNFTNIKVFWIRRWFRTLPNYYLMMIVYALLFYLIHHYFVITHYISYLFFLQNLTSEMSNEYFGVSWSLSIEEWFYLLFPLILFCIQFLFKAKKASFLATILLFMIIPLLTRIGFYLSNHNIPFDAQFRKIVCLRLDAIGTGVLAAYIKFYFSSFWDAQKKLLLTLGAIGFAVLMVILYNRFIVLYDFTHAIELGDSGFFVKTIFFSLLSISIALFIPFVSTLKFNNSNNYFLRSVNFISLISYSLYLLHPIVITIIGHFFKHLNGYIILTSIWSISIVGAYLQYRFFEKKITTLRERFGNKKYVVTV